MIPRRTSYNRVQSYPSSDSTQSCQSSASNQLENLLQIHAAGGLHMSAESLCTILDASLVSQKNSIRVVMDATYSSSHRKLINFYLDSTVLLLDACNSIQQRLESIRSYLNSIPIGLHYLEGEHEPNRAVLLRAASAFESSLFRDGQRLCSSIEKSMSRIKTFGKKLGRLEESNSIAQRPEVFKPLTHSWAMAFLAISLLATSTSFSTVAAPVTKPEPWAIMLNEITKALPKKITSDEATAAASIEELRGLNSAARALLKLVLEWEKGGNDEKSIKMLRRTAVKVLAGDLRKRKQALEKALAVLEEKLRELYGLLISLRVCVMGLIPKAQKEDMLEMVKGCGSVDQETKMEYSKAARFRKAGSAWGKVKTKMGRTSSIHRVRPPNISCLKKGLSVDDPISINMK